MVSLFWKQGLLIWKVIFKSIIEQFELIEDMN